MNRTTWRKRLLGISGLAGAAALAVAGCSSSSTTTSTGSSSPAAKVPLVVYSAQGYDKAMTAAFQKATGIPVKLDDNSTGPLLTQIEASKNNPNWGLLWVDGATAFAGLDQQGLLLKGFEPGVTWNSLGTQSLPADKSYTPTGVTLMAALVYDKTKVASPPTTWQALTQSQWKGAIGMNDPSQSGPTYPFIAGMMNHLGGVSAGQQYFTKLKSNGLVIHPTNGPTLQALTSGQIKLALVQSSAGIGAALGDKKLAVRYLNPVTILPSAIGIDAKAPAAEQAEAKKFIAARLLTQRPTRSTRVLDFLLLSAVALPSVVFGAGYIFAYNLPIMSTLGINLYQTVLLLVIAYTASSLPTNSRVLVGVVSQLQPSLKEAARTHGAGELVAWARGVLPVVSWPIVMAFLLTFCGVFLELPLSQLLYAPNSPPLSVAIEDNLSNYHFGVGMAQSVLAVAIALAAVAAVFGGYRLLAPAGWRRIGETTRG